MPVNALAPTSINALQNNAAPMSVFDRAMQEYPYLADKNISFVNTPNPKESRLLEFYAPDEPGSPKYPRPKELPMGTVGLQVFNSKVKPMDVVADYVSHYAVKNDPKLKEIYDQFETSLDPELLKQRYDFHKKKFGEKRSFEQWKNMTGVPELFRGYTFKQWENPEAMFTPAQIELMNQARGYVGVK
jgi:hypothetical protein